MARKKFIFDTSACTEGGIGKPPQGKELNHQIQTLFEWASNIDGVIGSINHNAMMTVLSIDVVISLLVEKGIITDEEFSKTHAALLRKSAGSFDEFFLELIDKLEQEAKSKPKPKDPP